MFDDKAIEAAQSRMESKRWTVDAECGEVDALVLDGDGNFSVRYPQEGRAGSSPVYDEYAAGALEDGVSVFEGFTMPRGQKWQKLKLASESLMAKVAVKQWLEKIEDRLFGLRGDPESGFTANVHQSSESLLALWGQSIWVDKRFDEYGRFAGLSYQSEDVAGVWVERTAEGTVMRVHRLIVLTAEQAKRKWGEKTPPKVLEALDGNSPRPDSPFEFLHVIERNDAMVPGRIDAAGKAWRACYYSRADKLVFETGGYRTLRRIVSTYKRKSGRDYGRSPAMRVLPAMRATQILMQDRTLGVEYQLKRPLLAMDDDLDQGVIDMAPWGITYGGLDEMGNAKIKPMFDSPDLNGAENLHAEVRTVLDKAFFRDLLQLNREFKTHVTALRTAEEIAEKGVLLAPLALQEQEWFAPMLSAELDLMWEEGLLDDMPQEIAEFFRAGGSLQVKYDNPLTQMMEAAEAAGYLRTAEQVSVLAPLNPDVVPAFTREYPLAKVIPGLGRANGIPARWQATDDEKAEADAAKQQQAQLEQIIAAAPALAQAGKTAAEAEAIGGF
jgi:hypothetical protein